MADVIVTLTPPPVITATVTPSAIAVSILASPAVAVTVGPVAGSHNGLAGIQGGALNDYYHLTAAKYNVLGLHESLTDLMGGLAAEHYHLSAAQYAALGTGVHNDLSSIQGGSALERYHLTAAQHGALGAVPAHNDLSSIQGGQAGQYYHMNAADYAARILGTGTAGYIPYFTAAQGIGNSNIFYDVANGRVGIGTAVPSGLFEISSSGGANKGINLKLTSAGSYQTIDFNTPTGLLGQFLATGSAFNNNIFTSNKMALACYEGPLSLVSSASAGYINFATGGYDLTNERMRIIANGNVGIGIAAPTAQLHLVKADSSALTDFLINPTLKTSGNLIDAQVGSVSKFSVRNDGDVFCSDVFLQTAQLYYGITGRSSGYIYAGNKSETTGNILTLSPLDAFINTSGTRAIFAITPTYNQATGTAANTDFLINRTQTAVGSGAQLLADMQVGSVSKFKVSNTGKVNSQGVAEHADNAAAVAAGLAVGDFYKTGDSLKVVHA